MCSFKIKKFVDKIMYLILIVCSLTILFSCRDEIMDDLQHSIEQKSSNQDSIAQLRSVINPSIPFLEVLVNTPDNGGNIPDIENYRDFRFENNYDEHQQVLTELLSYDYFPNLRNKTYSSMEALFNALIASRPFGLKRELMESGKELDEAWLDEHQSEYPYQSNQLYRAMMREKGNTLNDVTPIIEVFYNIDTRKVLTPKEAYDLLNQEQRMNIRKNEGSYSLNLGYFEVLAEDYCRVTGIPLQLIKRLRILAYSNLEIENNYPSFIPYVSILSFHMEQIERYLLKRYIYQFPYQDNYLDYQNRYWMVKDLKLLKRFIKPGSIIYVRPYNPKYYSKCLYKLIGEPNSSKLIKLNGFKVRHTMMVLPRWYETIENKTSKDIFGNVLGYKSFDEYKLISNKKSFIESEQMLHDMYNDDISLSDYLKRFVFIEAMPNEEYENYLMPFSNEKGVKLTSGNDRYFQDSLLYHIKRFEQGFAFDNKTGDHWIEIGIANINDGIKFEKPNLILNAFNHSMLRIGFRYAMLGELNANDYYYFEDEETNLNKAYCSGLVLHSYNASFSNVNGSNSIHLLKSSDKEALNNWFMPRTLIHSPYVISYGFMIPQLPENVVH